MITHATNGGFTALIDVGTGLEYPALFVGAVDHQGLLAKGEIGEQGEQQKDDKAGAHAPVPLNNTA